MLKDGETVRAPVTAKTAPRTRALPRTARRNGPLVRPRTPGTKVPPLAAEPAVKDRLQSYFAMHAARSERPEAVSQEALDAALAQVTDVLQVAEAEYHHALHQIPRTPGAAGGSRTAAQRAAEEAERALETALASYRAWDETLRSRGGGLYLRPDPIAALTEALALVRRANLKR
jgi:hypothetical protein